MGGARPVPLVLRSHGLGLVPGRLMSDKEPNVIEVIVSLILLILFAPILAAALDATLCIWNLVFTGPTNFTWRVCF